MDYSKTKIYKIWSPLGDKIYVGATTKNYLSERMTAHRHAYNICKKQPTRFNKLTHLIYLTSMVLKIVRLSC